MRRVGPVGLCAALALALTGLTKSEPSEAGCGPSHHYTDFGPVWSPRGDRIAFQRIEIGCGAPRAIYVIASNGGAPMRLPASGHPEWSPDGRSLVLSGKVTVVDAETGDRRDVRPRANDWALHPTWSPDGRRIAFSARGVDLGVIGVDGSQERRLTDTRDIAEWAPQWSPRGDLIAFRAGPSNIEVIRSDGSGRRHLFALGGGFISQSELAWSPDGMNIAFTYHVSGPGPDRLVVVRVSTGFAEVVVEGDLSGSTPSWSPDGSQLAFTRYVPVSHGPTASMRTVRPDGTDERDLGEGSDLAWSPDGNQIVFAFTDEVCPARRGLYVAGAEGAAPRRITNDCVIAGTSAADVLDGTPDDDVMLGGAGDDRMNASWGRDIVAGGPDADLARGQEEPDQLSGGAGDDVLYGDGGRDAIDGGPGRDRLYGGIAKDTIWSNDGEPDRVFCGPQADTVFADTLDSVSRDCERVRRFQPAEAAVSRG